MEQPKPIITIVGKNNVEVVFPACVSLADGTSGWTFDHRDVSLTESFGTEKIADRLDEVTARKADWEDPKWVEEYVRKRVEELGRKITAYGLAKTMLEKER